MCEYLPVYVPFHSPMLADALALVDEWAAQCGINAALAHSLAAAVLTTPVDWPAQISAAAESGATWIVDMGPGATTVRMTRALVEGTGVGVVAARYRLRPRQGRDPRLAPSPAPTGPTCAPAS